jgi:molecular chaperone DnaJ
MGTDYYSILGVNRSATTEDIKRAYRKLAHEHHPDKGGKEEKFKEINEAYQVLGDETKRKQYDQFGPAFAEGVGGHGQGAGPFGFDPRGGFNVRFEDLGGFGDIFSSFFGDESPFGTRARTRGRQRERGADLQVDVAIPFEEMVHGGTREFPLNRYRLCPRCKGNLAEPGTKIVTCKTCQGSGIVQRQSQTILGAFVQQMVCPDCRGEGKRASVPCRECRGEGRTRQSETLVVKIPAGIEDGTQLRIVGEGEAPVGGGDHGDLYVRVKVKEHKRFQRDGHDILSEVMVPFAVAALGGDVAVPTVDGEEQLSLPRATASGTEFRLKGKGIVRGRHGDTGSRGDHRVRVTIDVPKKLTKRQEELLREFGDVGPKKRFRLFTEE